VNFRSILASSIIVLILAVATPISAQDYNKGRAAYLNGNYKAAFGEFEPLAEQGNVAAQNYLGHMYGSGQGVRQNYVEAWKWYRRAAKKGDSGGQLHLGNMYLKGRGVLVDYPEAMKWYRLAAKQGSAGGQYMLGTMYAKGQGGLQDFVLAHMWLNLAAAQGLEMSGKERDIVGKEMPPVDLSAAQRLARECLARNYKNCGR
jgi:uncharacterized protein